MWESDTERKSNSQLHNTFLNTSNLGENLSVLTCHNNWRTAGLSLVENILIALEQFFIKNQIARGEKFFFQWTNIGRNVGHWRTAMRKRVSFGSQDKKCHIKRHGNLKSGVKR